MKDLSTEIDNLKELIVNILSDIKEIKKSNEKILSFIKTLENTSEGNDKNFINLRIF